MEINIVTQRKSHVTLSTTGAGTGVYHEAYGDDRRRALQFEGDPYFGGQGRAASPFDHLLGSLGACLQITAAIVSTQRNVAIGAFVVNIETDFDNRALLWNRDVAQPFTAVRIRIEVPTAMSVDQIQAFGAEVEARCPIHRLFVASGTPVDTRWNKV